MPRRTGVAAAERAWERREKAATRANMVSECEGWECKERLGGLLGAEKRRENANWDGRDGELGGARRGGIYALPQPLPRAHDTRPFARPLPRAARCELCGMPGRAEARTPTVCTRRGFQPASLASGRAACWRARLGRFGARTRSPTAAVAYRAFTRRPSSAPRLQLIARHAGTSSQLGVCLFSLSRRGFEMRPSCFNFGA